jgi:5-methylcytosine-specific restriction protein A
MLALELYFRVNPLHTSEKNPEIQKLSRLLNELPVHAKRPDKEVFRNPNGVYMKLCNFLRFDPGYTGKGLERGGKHEQSIWDEFAANQPRLRHTASLIRSNHSLVTSEEVASEVPSKEDEFPEGRILTAVHKRRERSPSLVRKKKAAVMEAAGVLACEVCGFDFANTYGDLGAGFAECHHIIPLSELNSARRTKLTDLAIVCANCHRMLHRSKPMLSVEGLRGNLT